MEATGTLSRPEGRPLLGAPAVGATAEVSTPASCPPFAPGVTASLLRTGHPVLFSRGLGSGSKRQDHPQVWMASGCRGSVGLAYRGSQGAGEERERRLSSPCAVRTALVLCSVEGQPGVATQASPPTVWLSWSPAPWRLWLLRQSLVGVARGPGGCGHTSKGSEQEGEHVRRRGRGD